MEEYQKQSHLEMPGNMYRSTIQVSDTLRKHIFSVP